MKRFWATAEATAMQGGFGILLDNKPLKKPSAAPLLVPFEPLAAAIAGEWRAAPENFGPDDLPVTRLATTATDRIPHHRHSIITELAAYALHDCLCYRAAAPPALAARQAQAWQPWLDWAAQTLGLPLASTTAIMPMPQPAATAATAAALLNAETEFSLAALGVAIPALGSFVLGLAIRRAALTPETALGLSVLEDIFQAESWGEDPDDAARRAAILADLQACARFWTLCHP